MGDTADVMTLTQPALGHDVQLGMLYDAYHSQFFAGVSLWKDSVVNVKQELDEAKIQNAEFVYSHSLEEARNNSSLDAEGSLSLDLKLFSATGSAKNATYIITTEKHSVWMVPNDLIKRWNKTNNSLEAALLTAMDKYLQLQLKEGLRKDILELAELSRELTSTVLLHDPTSLIKYVDLLIKIARARGAPSEHLMQLATAGNTLVIVREVKGKGEGATRDSMILLEVLGGVREEMKRRMKLSPNERATEEEKPCTLYNDLHKKLPAEIQAKAPKPLETQNRKTKGALYPENLKAVVKLVQAVLKDGGVVAALAASAGK
ncbi:hypothetical protein CBS147346_1268 [Aspergillus niger]|nr:hypothetical protein CBS147346_1268 [Aspergillus niger]